MANNQYSIEGLNKPTWGTHPTNLGSEMNQGGGKFAGHDQAWGDSLPELMNQGGSTKHPAGHPEGTLKARPALGKMMGQ